MNKGVLFDFDGTIIDSSKLIHGGLQHIANMFCSRTLEAHELNLLIGMTLKEQMFWLLGEDYQEGFQEFLRWYEEHHDDDVVAIEGLNVILDKLVQSGFRLGIVSNNEQSTILRGLACLGLLGRFEIIIACHDVHAGKPHPEGVWRALEMLSLKKETTLYVGDSASDVETAYNASVSSVLVGWSSAGPMYSGGREPHYLAQDPQELYRIIIEYGHIGKTKGKRLR